MYGFCGVVSRDAIVVDHPALVKSISLCDRAETHTIRSRNLVSAVSFFDDSIPTGPRYYETVDHIFCFAGDLVGHDSIPWRQIAEGISALDFRAVSRLRGSFGFAAFDKKDMQLCLISDHRAQLPLYYGYLSDRFVFSTDISTFTILQPRPDFNIDWLYESMFFNFPVGQTTCLQGVRRVPPASVVTFNMDSTRIQVARYSERLRIRDRLLVGREALDRCVATFKKVVPKYFDDSRTNFLGLTGGIDSRTLLATAPASAHVETYTYGIPGSDDLLAACALADRVGREHRSIYFGDSFLQSLPKLTYETVRLSGAMQGICRSTLLHIYRTLSGDMRTTPVAISGVSGGNVFRGHGYVPAVVSPGMEQLFTTGKASLDREVFSAMFGERRGEFKQHITEAIEYIRSTYGEPTKPECHLSYLVYEVAPKYFGGEAAIAGNYTVFRAPYWDIDLIRLAYETEYSTLRFSRFSEKKDTYRENVMQASVITTDPVAGRVALHGIPLSLYTGNNKPLYQIFRLALRGYPWLKMRVGRTLSPPAEAWGDWLKHPLHAQVHDLLCDKSHIADYIDKEFISTMRESNNVHWLCRLATAEIVLDLLRNRWGIQ